LRLRVWLITPVGLPCIHIDIFRLSLLLILLEFRVFRFGPSQERIESLPSGYLSVPSSAPDLYHTTTRPRLTLGKLVDLVLNSQHPIRIIPTWPVPRTTALGLGLILIRDRSSSSDSRLIGELVGRWDSLLLLWGRGSILILMLFILHNQGSSEFFIQVYLGLLSAVVPCGVTSLQLLLA